ncbi:MAG: glycosyltransferase [Proteobacteria bacterium]|nr:glycosyltransferase [Pseudomonadota bacterium]
MTGTPIPECMPSGQPWPRITVVTPTFNRGHMLEATIQSVLDQGYPNLEYIVMDGGSTDDTVELIKRYGDRITYWESEKDRGQSHALNKGFARATGELLTWLNSDDKYEPDALFSFALAYDMSGADLIAGMVQVVREGAPSGFHITSAAETNLLLSELLDVDGTWNGGKFFYQPEVIFTRAIWLKAGGYVDEDLHYSMDYHLWCRMAGAGGRLKVIGKSICAFLIHAQQKTLGNAVDKFKTELKSDAVGLAKSYGISPRYRQSGRALPRVCLVTNIGLRHGSGIVISTLASALMIAGHAVDVISLGEPLKAGEEKIAHPKISEVIDHIRLFDADVVIFGDIHGVGMPPEVVTEVGRHFLTFLLPHDLWWLTGRSLFPLESRDPLTSEREDFRDWATYPRTLPGRIPQLRLEKARVFGSPYAPIVLANSRWTRDVYRRSLAAMGARTRTIRVSLGVPDAFRPHDKAECRLEFGLPDSGFIIATSAPSNEARKGIQILLEAVRMIKDSSIVVAFAGERLEQPFAEDFQTFCCGDIDDDAKLSRFYSAADVVVSPSLMETQERMLLEASASGVPTMAFAGAGTEDAVKSGVTGVLVRDISAEALAAAIQDLRRSARLRAEMAFWGPLFVANEFSIYKSYYSIYRAFEEVGLYSGGDFKRKIDFEQNVKGDVHTTKLIHGVITQSYSGISEEIGPYAPLSIGRHRWVRQREAFIDIYNGSNERRAKMIFELRNYHNDQRMRILVNDTPCIDERLRSDFERRQLFELDVLIPSGDSRVRIETTKIRSGFDGSPESILIENFLII